MTALSASPNRRRTPDDLQAKPPPKSWRDVLPVHPAADLFPRMSADEIKVLGEDIKRNGLKIPVVSRRRALIMKLARGCLARPRADAEIFLQQELDRQRRVLRRKPFSDQVIETQVRSLESAVRAVLWRLVLSPSPPIAPPGAR